jgi:hypothetical protein
MTAEDDRTTREGPELPVEERTEGQRWPFAGPMARLLHAPLNDLLDGCREQQAADPYGTGALFEATRMVGDTDYTLHGRVSVHSPGWSTPDTVTVFVYAWVLTHFLIPIPSRLEHPNRLWLLLHRRGPVDGTKPFLAEDTAWALSRRVGGSDVLTAGHLPRFSLRLAASRAEQLAMATAPEHP